MQKGQGLLQGGKAAAEAAGAAIGSSPSLSHNNPAPSALSPTPVPSPGVGAAPPPSSSGYRNPTSSPHTSSSSPAPSPRNPNPNPYPHPSPSLKSYPNPNPNNPSIVASPSPADFHQFHLHPHHQKPQQPSPSLHFTNAQQQQQQWQQQLQHLQQQQQAQQQHLQQQQQTQQHHLQQQQQQQQQQQGQQPPSHHLQQYRKGVPNEHFPAYQGPVFQGAGGSGSANGLAAPLRPPRVYTDASQQQLPLQVASEAAQAVNQQVQAQAYAHQALLAAQRKAQANAQQSKTAIVADQGGSQSAEDVNNNHQNHRQLQARQGHVSINKAAGQYLLTEQQMEQAHDLKNDATTARAQPGYATSMPNTMRPPASGALQNQQQLVVNGQTPVGMPPMPALQSHHLDPNMGSLLPPTQFMHPQLLAQLTAMQKTAADTGPGLQHLHHTASKSQDVGMRNLGPPNAQQHGGAVMEGHSSPGLIMGKGHQNMSSGSVSSPNLRSSDYSIERGVLSLNRPAGNVPSPSVPVLVNKSPVGAPLPSRADKGPGAPAMSCPDDTELQYLRQQQLQASMPTSQVSNALIPQANFHQQLQQQQDLEHSQVMPLQQQQQHHHPYQQGGLQHFQQQQLKQKQPQPQPQPHMCFTRQQLMVLKSQILAFRRLKRGERIPTEVLRSIAPPPLSSQQSILGMNTAERPPFPLAIEASPAAGKDGMEKHVVLAPSSAASKLEGKAQIATLHVGRSDALNSQPSQVGSAAMDQCSPASKQEDVPMAASTAGGQCSSSEQAVKADSSLVSNANMPSRPSSPGNALSGALPQKPMPVAPNQQKPLQLLRRYRGPLFDFPPIARKIDSLFQSNNPWGLPIPLGYDVRQLLSKEGARVIDRKKSEKLKFIDALLASGLDKKCIPAELITKLRIEKKKLRLMSLQSRVREEVEEQQQDIMAMGERGYRKFVRFCERQRADLARQVVQLQKSTREKQLKSLFSWRKRLFEAHWGVRDARTTRNRGVAKYHERMLREFSKRRDEDRNKRMEALKNNDVDTYREMLKQQQTKLPGDAGERFQVLSSFLSQTEEYLYKLGGKISAVKYQQEREEAAVAATLAAKAQGLSEEEVEAAAIQAREEVDARLQSPDRASDSVSKYYSLAHAVNERIVRQPSMLRAGILRDYQLVGLQWMLSLYNNRLNGILADEMGLGKTVQVMALIAYLMEFKGNYGPHLIIVPNAVLVNWKSELLRWIPSVSCIFYVGGKEQRSKLYSQEVCALKFNVLVTTYEFIMRDRSKLSKVEWKYLIIDEAQRMKDRESRLSRDLDRFRCQRRLLLTGTPLQNDLRELWSLLNLLLPEVFDNSKSFQDWFSMPFQKDGTSLSPEDDWLETEKKVIVIHRLHQILEPFMLRRRVEDVEGSLPAKVPVVLRCKMSALQAAIYDWIKATGTIRLDPQDEEVRVARNGKRQKRAYAPLQNKGMELRKVCNHPLLNYPFYSDRMNEFSVRSCGKLWILDRILIKLQNTGHRVLLFSTMTRLLDILEEYLQWRNLIYRRIDGTTTLECRESAIVEFNRAGSDCFIFLLSIRAAGRGLNLQTADTVIIYDPDPNPKNEEQAVARSHRIGQKREVRVIYMEAVVETISSFEKEDEIRSGGRIDMEDDDMAGKDRYVGSVESLVRNTIQQHKIDMADEVINAGRFDQRTTQEERRLTLEALLHDEERYEERVHDVPSLQEVNRMIARSDEEVEFFDQLDEEYDWPGEMLQHHQIPKWLCVGSQEVNAAVGAMSKQASKKGTVEGFGTAEAEEKLLSEPFDKVSNKKRDTMLERKYGLQNSSSKQRGLSVAGNTQTTIEVTEEVRKDVFDDEEEGEIRKETDEDDTDAQMYTEPEEGEVSEEELEGARQANNESLDMNCVEKGLTDIVDRASESSQDEEEEELRRNEGGVDLTSSLSQQKFGSLAALDSRPTTQVTVDELEEGEIAASGDSHFEAQPSESSAQEQDDGEDEQDLQPRIKRKRSARLPRRRPLEKVVTSGGGGGGKFLERALQPALPFPQLLLERPLQEIDRQLYSPVERPIDRQLQGFHEQSEGAMETKSRTPDQSVPPAKRRQLLEPILGKKSVESVSSRQHCIVSKHSRVPGFTEQCNDAVEPHKESAKLMSCLNNSPSVVAVGRMLESTQKKCKAVLQKLKGAVEKEGHQAAVIFELPKRTESPGYYKVIVNPVDSRTIKQRLDRFEYGSVIDFAADVLLMLDNAARFYKSPEVKAYIWRLQAMYYHLMHHSFPDINFGSLKTRILSQATISSGSSPRQQFTQIGTGRSQAGPSVSLTAHPATKTNETNEERPPRKSPHIESKRSHKKGKVVPVVQKTSERIKMKLEHGKDGGGPEEPRHPVDLVFCKKKRKNRGKILNKIRTINMAASADTNLGKNTGSSRTALDSENRIGVNIVGKKVRTVGVSSSDSTKHARSLKVGASQAGTLLPAALGQRAPEKVQVQGFNRGAVSLGADQWLTPVKKMRTDGGKRRPSYV